MGVLCEERNSSCLGTGNNPWWLVHGHRTDGETCGHLLDTASRPVFLSLCLPPLCGLVFGHGVTSCLPASVSSSVVWSGFYRWTQAGRTSCSLQDISFYVLRFPVVHFQGRWELEVRRQCPVKDFPVQSSASLSSVSVGSTDSVCTPRKSFFFCLLWEDYILWISPVQVGFYLFFFFWGGGGGCLFFTSAFSVKTLLPSLARPGLTLKVFMRHNCMYS